ncbi:MAG: purine/pyrimidine permease [Clostridiales bacterium]|nr:purine/pyrimidine permease [Clostridiales bacterium]
MNNVKLFNISSKDIILGFQHLLAMFGATTLVPLLTGFSVPVALFSAGAGTLIFHMVTRYKVPIFLGSSFAFIPVVILVVERTGNLQYAQGGIVVAGLLYTLFSYLVYKIGVDKISRIFQPHIVGTMIFIVGFTLIPTAIDMVNSNVALGSIVATIALWIQLSAKGFIKQMSILVAIVSGYIIGVFFNAVDFSPIVSASWLIVPDFSLPKFDLTSIFIIAPVVLAVFMEHIGDIIANQTITGKNYLEDPGLHRTLLGDGVATLFAGMIGGPANTTYSENTGILALTKNYDPKTLRIAAVYAILISFAGKLAAIFTSIPTAVLGGISLTLFNMISAIGIKTIYRDQSYKSIRKIIVIIFMLITGFRTELNITEVVSLSSMSVAAVAGILSNTILEKIFKLN